MTLPLLLALDRVPAAAHSLLSQVLNLLQAGVSVNTADYDGRTSLHLAASEGHYDIAKELLTAGADDKLKDRCPFKISIVSVLCKCARCRWNNTALADAQRYSTSGRYEENSSSGDIAQLLSVYSEKGAEALVDIPVSLTNQNTKLLSESERVAERKDNVSQSCQELLASAADGDLLAIKRLARKGVEMNQADYDDRWLTD